MEIFFNNVDPGMYSHIFLLESDEFVGNFTPNVPVDVPQLSGFRLFESRENYQFLSKDCLALKGL